MIKGIDVSRHNGTINWEAVKNSGVKFAIIRIGWGSDQITQDDSQAKRNIAECERVGMPYGLYIYSYALNINDAVSEAEHMDRFAKACNPTMGLWFDMEDADHYKINNGLPLHLNGALYTQLCVTWLQRMKQKGYPIVGTYASKSVLVNELDLNVLRANGEIWNAQWGVSNPAIPCRIWQYTSDGTVSGINGRVDMNYGYMDIQNNTPVEQPTEQPPVEHIVTGGDTLTGISALYGVSVDDIVLTNVSQYPLMTKNYIQKGWVLKIPRQKPIPKFHKVEKGDTLWKIAKTYKTTVNDILLKNIQAYPKIMANYIRVGWRLTL